MVVLQPPVAEQIAADPRSLDLVSKKLKHAAYAGGTISRLAGERLSAATNLFCIYACTENGVFPLLRPASPWNPDLWNQVCFHEKAGVSFRHLGDDSYELVVVRNSDPEDVQPVFKLFPDLHEWHSKDVFTPVGQGYWVYQSRIDDLLHFSSGIQFNPVLYEESIREHPDVVAALMYGDARPFPVLLMELAEGKRTEAQCLDDAWPHIQHATDAMCPEGIKIRKNRIVLVQKDRPLSRAYKGTLQRSRSFQAYTQEIEAIYSDARD